MGRDITISSPEVVCWRRRCAPSVGRPPQGLALAVHQGESKALQKLLVYIWEICVGDYHVGQLYNRI